MVATQGRLQARGKPAMHRRLPRLLFYSLMAAVPALGALVGLGSAASASTAAAPAAQATAAARSALKQLVIGQHATDHPVSGHVRMINGLTQVSSTNWSGYADDNSSGNTYSKVSGNWTEPSASCTSTESLAAFWVGIDGYSSGSVEQDGTLIECYRSRAYYYTWWEMYPSNAIQVVGGSVSPGDSISSSVAKSGSSYTLKVTDSTHPANSFTTTQTCSSCVDTSAEWIAEAPSGSSGVYPLSNFRSWSTSGASVTSGSATRTISSFPDDELTMINNAGSVKAQPGSLSSGGNSFTVTWERSS
jgi:hypothetical protein